MSLFRRKTKTEKAIEFLRSFGGSIFGKKKTRTQRMWESIDSATEKWMTRKNLEKLKEAFRNPEGEADESSINARVIKIIDIVKSHLPDDKENSPDDKEK